MAEQNAISLRVSDAEREQAADELRRHAGEGRLTPEELEERLEAAYAARTAAELDALRADLPPLPAAAPATRSRARSCSPERDLARRRVAQRAGGLAITVLICVAVWAATGAGYFWPVWVLLGCGAALARGAWAELGPGARGEEHHRDAHGRGGF